MYKTFAHHSRYWTLFVGFLQTNITPIVFYASIQFNLFFSFDSVSKANLVFTLLIFFSILVYISLFYPIIYNYSRKRSFKTVTEYVNPANHHFLLEMALKCFRSFSMSLIHGLFINNNINQLIGLIVFDIILLCIIKKYWKHFLYKIIFV